MELCIGCTPWRTNRSPHFSCVADSSSESLTRGCADERQSAIILSPTESLARAQALATASSSLLRLTICPPSFIVATCATFFAACCAFAILAAGDWSYGFTPSKRFLTIKGWCPSLSEKWKFIATLPTLRDRARRKQSPAH